MGNSSGKNKRKQTKAFDNLNINQLLKNMMIASDDITQNYLVKSPPNGKSEIGEIREVVHKQFNRKNILKILYLNMFNSKEIEMILNEIQISKKLKHPNILEIVDYSFDAQNIYIVMEFFKGRNLEERIMNKKLNDEVSIYQIFKEIVSLVKYMHNEGIVHRDLRLSNILFDGKRVKLDDFQKAVQLSAGKKLKEVTGNPFYVAPEILKGKYDHRIDIWALGVILYTLVFNKYPFYGSNTEETIDNIQNNDFEPEYDFSSANMSLKSKIMLIYYNI